MTDWKAAAAARGIVVPEQDLERIVQILQAAEKTLRPLIDNLPWDLDPAVTFCAAEEDR